MSLSSFCSSFSFKLSSHSFPFPSPPSPLPPLTPPPSNRFGPFSPPVTKSYLHQLLLGLTYLHSHSIIHRDIKGGNILVDDRGTVKLADFGASKQVNDGTLQGMASSMKGTPYFMAPEVLSHEKYGRKADVWSLGGVAFQMATGEPPWKALGLRTPVALFYHIQTNEEGPPMPEEVTRNVPLHKLLVRCFERDPAERPTCGELLEDPYFQDEGEEDDDDDSENDSQTERSGRGDDTNEGHLGEGEGDGDRQTRRARAKSRFEDGYAELPAFDVKVAARRADLKSRDLKMKGSPGGHVDLPLNGFASVAGEGFSGFSRVHPAVRQARPATGEGEGGGGRLSPGELAAELRNQQRRPATTAGRGGAGEVGRDVSPVSPVPPEFFGRNGGDVSPVPPEWPSWAKQEVEVQRQSTEGLAWRGGAGGGGGGRTNPTEAGGSYGTPDEVYGTQREGGGGGTKGVIPAVEGVSPEGVSPSAPPSQKNPYAAVSRGQARRPPLSPPTVPDDEGGDLFDDHRGATNPFGNAALRKEREMKARPAGGAYGGAAGTVPRQSGASPRGVMKGPSAKQFEEEGRGYGRSPSRSPSVGGGTPRSGGETPRSGRVAQWDAMGGGGGGGGGAGEATPPSSNLHHSKRSPAGISPKRGSPGPSPKKASAAPPDPDPASWTCVHCSTSNADSSPFCGNCAKWKVADWQSRGPSSVWGSTTQARSGSAGNSGTGSGRIGASPTVKPGGITRAASSGYDGDGRRGGEREEGGERGGRGRTEGEGRRRHQSNRF